MISESVLLYGLTPEFGQAMRVAVAIFAAIYLVYPLVLVLAWLIYRKGWRKLAFGSVVALAVLGLGVPLADQAKHALDRRAIEASEIHADRLDVAGQHVVVVRRVCADLCKWLLRYGGPERVTLVDATRAQREVFARTGVFPAETEAFDVVLDRLSVVKRPVTVDIVTSGQTLFVRRDFGVFAQHMPSHLPPYVAAGNIKVSTFVAPSNWGAPLDDWAPTILTLIHSDQAFLLPLHPFARTNRPGMDFENEGAYLADLLCPWPNGRLGRVCHEDAKPRP